MSARYVADMADVLDLLDAALSPKAVGALAGQLGLDAGDAAKVIAAVLPELVERLGRNAQAGDAEAIATAATKDHDGSLLDDAVGFLGGRFTGGAGAGILGHVFGDQLDAVTAKVAGSTGVPAPVVGLAFRALAPLVMAALTKAAIGAVTAVVVVKLLDVAVDQIRSGKVQRWLGGVNDRFDTDNDGSAADDVGRRAMGATKSVFGKLRSLGKRVATDPRVKRGAAKGGKAATKAASKAAGSLGSRVLSLARRWRR